MSLSKTLYPLLGSGSTQEDSKNQKNDRNIVDLEHQHKEV